MTALSASLSSSAPWYLARGTGVVTLLLFTAVMVLGLLGQQRFAAGPQWPRFAIDTLHRDVSLLAVALLAVHIITSVLDTYAPIKLLDAIIPFASTYRPLWLGLGALAFDLMLAVVITSLVRRRIGLGGWKAVHWLAYLSWPVAVLHGLGTGSDSKQWWNLALTAICVVAVGAAVVVRIARPGASVLARGLPNASEPRVALGPRAERPGMRRLGIAAAILTCLWIAAFTLVGPLEKGWAGRAGTPKTLLGVSSAPVAARPVRVSVQTIPFDATLSGTQHRMRAAGGEVLDFTLTVSGAAHGELRIRIAGRPIAGGGVAMVGSQVELWIAGLGPVAQGRVVALDGSNLIAHVAATTGTLQLRVGLSGAGPGSGPVTGTMQVLRSASGG